MLPLEGDRHARLSRFNGENRRNGSNVPSETIRRAMNRFSKPMERNRFSH
jgi:tRNA uridine 5-carbamoylmethylation protein Kti12